MKCKIPKSFLLIFIQNTRGYPTPPRFFLPGRVHLTKTSTSNPRLTALTKLALALPEAKRELHGSHASFLVRKRTFAYFLHNHHGDGIVAVACKVLPGENAALATAQPKRYYLPAYIGPRGWAAFRLDAGKIDWDEVGELLLGSYLLTAPKRLAALVQSDA
jgi:hypothetical protein